MQIDISKINRDFFNIKEEIINNEKVFLINSKIDCTWNQDNLIFRSSIWDSQGNLISASFKKFFNWNEKPDIDPKPINIFETKLMEKIDGSTLIVSKFKEHIFIRTRSSFSVEHCTNKNEIDEFKNKYPKIFQVPEGISYIFEWISPTNKIILDYKKPDLILTTIINHKDYSMWTQNELDKIAKVLQVKRPKIFNFSSIKEMLETIKIFKGIEGLCVYYDNDQKIRKVKTADYLLRHHLKSKISFEDVLDIYIKCGKPNNYKFFYEQIKKEYDFESLEFLEDYLEKIFIISEKIEVMFKEFKIFASKLKQIGLTKKEAAEQIFSTNKQNSFFIFQFFYDKEIDNRQYKQLFLDIYKKLQRS